MPAKAKIINKPKEYQRGKRVINVANAIRDRAKGLNLSDIARKQHVTPQAVHQSLSGIDKLLLSKPELNKWQKNETSLIDSAKVKLLLASVDKRLTKASTLQCITGYGILTDKSLLLQGKATSNINIYSVCLQANNTLDEINERLTSAQIVGSGTPVELSPVDK